MKVRFAMIWDWLTKPSAAIKEAEPRYRARMLSALLIPVTLSLLPGSILAPANISLILKTQIVVLLLAYGLSRTKYYTAAAILSFFSLSVLAPAILPLIPAEERLQRTLFACLWLAPNFLLVSLILPIRQTVGFIVVNFMMIVGLTFYLIGHVSPDLIEAWTYLGIISALIILAGFVRQRYLDQIRQNSINLAHARDQALEASRFKTELLTKVSHDLRSPLGAILGYAEMLEMGIYGPLSERQRQILTAIMETTQFQSTLISDLVNQAQLEAGQIKINPRPFDLAELVEAIQQKMSVLARNKGLSLICYVEGQSDLHVIGDPSRIEQVVLNLVGNAIKFTESGSVQVRFFQPDPAVWAIRVTDTGPGIPGEFQEVVFEAFRQLDNSHVRKAEGMGLGLSIVKQLTELMGGEVQLESKVGQGSTFTVILPLQPALDSPV